MNWQPPDEVRFRRRFPVGALLLFLLGVFIAVAGGFAPDAIPFAVTSLVLALAVFALAPAGLTLRFHPDCLENREAGTRIPYHEINFLRLTNRALFDSSSGKAPEMHIGHAHGCLRLGRHAAIPRDELYQFLLAKSRLLAPPSVLPGQLMEVYEREVADFGEDQVLASTGREASGNETQSGLVVWLIAFALLLGAVASWAVDASDNVSSAFGIFTGIFMFFALVFFVLFRAQRRALLKLRRACGIVISPRGLTMDSPLIKGAITWEEVKGVTVVNRSQAQLRGLMLKIEGGQFFLGDHYICPVTEIYRRIVSYRSFERKSLPRSPDG